MLPSKWGSNMDFSLSRDGKLFSLLQELHSHPSSLGYFSVVGLGTFDASGRVRCTWSKAVAAAESPGDRVCLRVPSRRQPQIRVCLSIIFKSGADNLAFFPFK